MTYDNYSMVINILSINNFTVQVILTYVMHTQHKEKLTIKLENPFIYFVHYVKEVST